MRYIQKAICGAKTFSDTPIYSQLQNIIFTTVEDQLDILLSFLYIQPIPKQVLLTFI